MYGERRELIGQSSFSKDKIVGEVGSFVKLS